MLYLGIDCHRSFSHCTILNESGQRVFRGKLPHSEEEYTRLFSSFPQEEIVAVVEAGYNWGTIYELMIGLGIEIKVGHPANIKAIASARIKTDKRDSNILAYLLKANLIPEIYVPPKIIRELKYVLRERLSIVKDRTRLKNKIHGLLVRSLVHPEGISDIFGTAGRKYIDSLELHGHAGYLLRHYLDMFDLKTAELKGFEKYLKNTLKDNRYTELLKTIPGIGDTLSALISLEVHDISRFPTHKQFASYCGLVPTTHSSGNKITNGHLTPSCNKYLRTALIEGSWIAVGKSPYFKQRYERLKKRMKPNVAIAAVARRMSEIIFCMLKEDRAYTERYTKDI